jgi:hypothetical protein
MLQKGRELRIATYVSSVVKELRDGTEREKFWAWLIVLASLPLVLHCFPGVRSGHVYGDLRVYYDAGRWIQAGLVPYKQLMLEYPPYSLLCFVLPGFAGEGGFIEAFSLEMLLVDLSVKWTFIALGCRYLPGWRAFIPFGLISGCGLFQMHFYLERFDLVPASVSIAAILLASRGAYRLAGFLIVFAAGLKLYPALFFLPLLFLAMGKARGREFAVGALWGVAPALLILPWVPWWRFLLFHLARGLQVETLYASVLWFWHFFWTLDLQWASVTREGGRIWLELEGNGTTAVVGVARVLFPVATIASVTAACWRLKSAPSAHLGFLARVLLLPLLSFVTLNTVLSPQYTIWLVALAGLGCTWGSLGPMIIIGVCSWVTPIFYPSRNYDSGLSFGQTMVLLVRNLALLGVWLALFKEMVTGLGGKGKENGLVTLLVFLGR